MFTNKVRCSIIQGGKGKDGVALIKSLIYEQELKEALWGACYKESKVDPNCELIH